VRTTDVISKKPHLFFITCLSILLPLLLHSPVAALDSVVVTGLEDGAPDQFTIVRNGAGYDVTINGGPVVTYVNIERITFDGTRDDDTLTVDFSGGDPVPLAGLFFNGMGQMTGGDVLVLTGGSAAEMVHSYQGSDGTVVVDGSVITFTGLEPVIDLVPGTVTVNGTNANNTVTYTDGVITPGTNGQVAVDAFETYEFSNKTTLTIDALLGNDYVFLTNPNTPTGLTAIAVLGGGGEDVIQVSVDSPVAVTLNGDGEDDTFNVRPSSTQVITVNGGSHFAGDTLVVDPMGNPAVDTGVAVQVSGFADVSYSNIEQVIILGQDPGPIADLEIWSTGCDPSTDDCDLSTDLDPVTAGNLLRYTLPVTNTGPDTAANVYTVLDLPPEVQMIALSASDGECNAGTPGDPSDPATCIFDELDAGESGTVSVFVTVSPDTPIDPNLPCDQPSPFCRGRIFADARIWSDDVVDPDLSNNLDTQSTDVNFSADLQVFKNDTPDLVTAGEQLSYEVIVNNAGPSTSREVIMLDHFPDEVEFLSAVVIDIPTGTEEDCTINADNRLVCELGDIPPGTPPQGQKNIFINVMVKSDTSPGTITNEASAFSFVTDDPDDSNNLASAGCTECSEDTNVVTEADLSVELYSEPDKVNAGEQKRYTVVVENHGPSDDPGALVTVNLPPETAYEVDTGDCVEVGAGVLDCDLNSMPAGSKVAFDIYALVDPAVDPGTVITCTAGVSGTTSEGDPNPVNDTDSVDNLALGLADLRILKFGKPDGEVMAGEVLTYTIVVDNLGPGFAHDVELMDMLRSDGDFNLLDVSSDLPADCSPTSGTYAGELDLSCSLIDPLDHLTPLSSGRWTITVGISADEAQDINNAVVVIGSDPDPEMSNNTATVEHTISDAADMSIAMMASQTQVIEGETVTLTIDVLNDGPSEAENVVVMYQMPAGMILADAYVTGAAGSCTGEGSLTCSLGNLALLETRTITVEAVVMLGIGDGTALHPGASVVSDVFDTDGSNNFASVFVVVGTALLFADDFSDGSDFGDPDWDVLDGNWTVTGRKKFRSGRYHKNLVVVTDGSLPFFETGMLETEFKLTNKARNNPHGFVVFGLQDDSNYRYVKFVKNDDGKGWVHIGQEGDFGGATEGTKAKGIFNLKLKKWYTLSVKIYPDGWVRVFVNSRATPVVSYRFPSTIDGDVGYRAKRAKTLFDNFAAWYETVLE
jgi:uncharacterized repeat protein (TIGR01451 family)